MTKSFSISFLFLLLSFNSNSQNSIIINGEENIIKLKDKASLFISEDTALSFKQIKFLPQSEWINFKSNTPNLGYQKNKTVWIKLSINNVTNDFSEWILHYNASFLESIQVYFEDVEGNMFDFYDTGRSKAFNTRGDYNDVAFAFPITFSKHKAQTIWIKISSDSPILLPVDIIDNKSFQNRTANINLYYGIYFGCIVIMLIYNLFIYLTLRDLNYLFYTFTIICTLFVFGSVSGYLYKYITPNNTWLNTYSVRIGMAGIVITTSIFARFFLKTKEYSKESDYALLITALLSIPAVILVITDLYPPATNTLVSLQSILLLISGVLCWRNGNRYARYYTLAWLIYIIGGISMTLRNAGIFPVNIFTNHGAEIGSALEVAIISIALSDRYNIIRREKDKLTREKQLLLEGYNLTLEEKVNERTDKIAEANHALRKVNKKLEFSLTTVQQQKEEIEAQKNDIEAKSKELAIAYDSIQASISYAKRIQDAKLPQEHIIKEEFPESFIFFKPRSIVSGDFYWFTQTEEKTLIAVADCTGHGVPGALISMIGSKILDDAVLRIGITQPNKILEYLHDGIRTTLKQNESQNRDGMDIALCAFDKKNKILQFSGAKRPLVHIHNNKINYVKGDKSPIGGLQIEEERKFNLIELNISEPTTLYMYTDGFQDQFGGPSGRKFMVQQLRSEFLKHNQLSMDAQKAKLEETLDEWINYNKSNPVQQLDDILIIGIKLG